jgi:hypothetical protein
MAPPADHAQIQALQDELARIPRNRTVSHRIIEHMFDYDAHPVQYNAQGHVISLRLDFMALTRLPPELGHRTHLDTLDLSENPLVSPPPDVVAQGTAAVLAYLRAQRG